MTRAISLHDVSKAYTRGHRVVDQLSLDIAPGEFLVLLGPSGCGKSTVLRMIAGLEEIDGGNLFLDGEYANDLPPAERDMAMVFQNFALYPSMTSRDNIGFPLRIEAPGTDPSPRVDATARMLGIEDLLDRFPAQLSGRACRCRCWSTSPTCSSSTGTGSGSAPIRRACPTSTSDAPLTGRPAGSPGARKLPPLVYVTADHAHDAPVPEEAR